MHPLGTVIRVSSIAGILALVIGLTTDTGLNWFAAHGLILLVGVVIPIILYLLGISLAKFGSAPDPKLVKVQAILVAVATFMIGAGYLLQPSGIFAIVAWLGVAVLMGAAIVSMRIFRTSKPTGPLTDVEKDPLTKGDDASFKHIKMAHMFLPLGLVFLFVGLAPGLPNPWAARFMLSGLHIVMLGFVVVGLYGIGHLWVPRFSGVPAIAAGAIKGELHSTMPALILIPAGFLSGVTGLLIAGGAFAFLGFFTYMGVLGANIMRNKSVTHRVTPEFVYIPWTFAGIFWLISGVLMGIFMTVVPDVMADRVGALRGVHIHINLLGGVAQLALAWMIPMQPTATRFSGAMKLAFYGFNVAVALAVGTMIGSASTTLYLVAAGILAFSLLAYIKATGGLMKAAPSGQN